MPDSIQLRARTAELTRQKRRRRRQGNLCFFAAGIGFGTTIYLLRAHFTQVMMSDKRILLGGLVAFVCSLVWLGASGESDIRRMEEELREIEQQRQQR